MAEDYPYALDLELVDSQGRKTGLFHMRANSAPDMLAEFREIDSDFGLALGEVVQNIRTFSLLKTELGVTPVAQGAPARPARQPRQAPRQAPPSHEGQDDYPFPDEEPPGTDGPPVCAHGPMRYVPPGTSRNGKPYSAFYGCTADRNDPNRCKTVPA